MHFREATEPGKFVMFRAEAPPCSPTAATRGPTAATLEAVELRAAAGLDKVRNDCGVLE